MSVHVGCGKRREKHAFRRGHTHTRTTFQGYVKTRSINRVKRTAAAAAAAAEGAAAAAASVPVLLPVLSAAGSGGKSNSHCCCACGVSCNS